MTNDNERIYVVYMHRNKINGKVYIGIAKNVKRRWGQNGSGYGMSSQRVFCRAIEKYGWDGFDHIILHDGLTHQEACEIEISLIAQYKSNACRYGADAGGYNMTDGGEGCHGVVPSEAKRKKQSELMTGKNNPMYGKHHTPEARAAISQARKGKFGGETHYNYGKHLSEETKQKIRDHLPDRSGKNSSRAIPVVCVDTQVYYDTITAACKAFQTGRQTIVQSCKTGEPTWFGMTFEYIQLPAD